MPIRLIRKYQMGDGNKASVDAGGLPWLLLIL
jgi:hypothetical protein